MGLEARAEIQHTYGTCSMHRALLIARCYRMRLRAKDRGAEAPRGKILSAPLVRNPESAFRGPESGRYSGPGIPWKPWEAWHLRRI
jgi:hypothetical protein